MKVRIQPKGLKSPRMIDDVQSIVVYDEHGNPMYISQQIDQNTCVHEKAGHSDFERLLKNLGIGLNTKYILVKD